MPQTGPDRSYFRPGFSFLASGFMETVFRGQAQAKVNLSLRVVRRRPDGYHDLDSLMARLDLADYLTLSFPDFIGRDQLTVSSHLPRSLPDGFEGPDNLVLKAVQAYRRQCRWPEKAVRVFLEKNIPFGAGLGGGSADCAAILELLNRASPQPLTDKGLAELGLSLGADVPFCLFGRPLARAEGVGERLSGPPAETISWLGRELLLVNPGFELSTASVFQKLGLTNGAANNNLGPVSESLPGENDLLAPALELAPELASVAEAVAALNPEAWGLSGSGATFWLYARHLSADSAAEKFPACWVRPAVIC